MKKNKTPGEGGVIADLTMTRGANHGTDKIELSANSK